MAASLRRGLLKLSTWTLKLIPVAVDGTIDWSPNPETITLVLVLGDTELVHVARTSLLSRTLAGFAHVPVAAVPST